MDSQYHGQAKTLERLDESLRDSLRSAGGDATRQQRAINIQKEAWGRQGGQAAAAGTSEAAAGGKAEDPDMMRQTEKDLKDKEEQIKKKKAEVTERVKVQSERVMLEAKKLDQLRKELDTIEDPTKKDVSDLRKRIEVVDRELRPMKALCDRKERELKEARQQYNDKNAQKSELVGKLFEIVTESEKERLKKLEEINVLLRDMEARSGN